MRRERLRLLVPALLALSLSSCGSQDYTDIVFGEDDLVQSSFGGLGVEWGVYEDTDMLDENSFKRIYANIKELAPARIRCMFNYDSFVKDFDDKGDDDKTNDTWTYDFANKWGDNLFEILRYCQSHGIQVAAGSWNVIGDLRNDVWGHDGRVHGGSSLGQNKRRHLRLSHQRVRLHLHSVVRERKRAQLHG
jgi:hypothetical protein